MPLKWMRSPHTSIQVERKREDIEAQSKVCAHHPSSYRWRGERGQRANQVYALTTHQATGGEEMSHSANQVSATSTTHQAYRWMRREDIEPLKCMRLTPTSYRWRGERGHRSQSSCMRSANTPATGGEGEESHRWHSSGCRSTTHTSYTLEVERVIVPIKWMRSPHTSYRWRGDRGETKRPIKVYALTTTPATGGEGGESLGAITCMRSPHTS